MQTHSALHINPLRQNTSRTPNSTTVQNTSQKNRIRRNLNNFVANVQEHVMAPSDFFKNMNEVRLNSKNSLNENIVHRFVNKLIGTGERFFPLKRIVLIYNNLDAGMKDLKTSCEKFGVDLGQLLSEKNSQGLTAKQCLEAHYNCYTENKVGLFDTTKKSLALLDAEQPISHNEISIASRELNELRYRLEFPFKTNLESVREYEKPLNFTNFLSPATINKPEDIFFKTDDGNTIVHRFIDKFIPSYLLTNPDDRNTFKTGIEALKHACKDHEIDIQTILDEKNNKKQTAREYFIEKLDRAHVGRKPEAVAHAAQKNRLGELFDALVTNSDTTFSYPYRRPAQNINPILRFS